MASGLLTASKKLLELAIWMGPEIVTRISEKLHSFVFTSFLGAGHCNGLLGERRALFRALLPKSSLESHHRLRGSVEGVRVCERLQFHHAGFGAVMAACQGSRATGPGLHTSPGKERQRNAQQRQPLLPESSHPESRQQTRS